MEGPVQRRGLKDKFREHWNTRDEIWAPKPQKANKMGVIFTWTYAISMVYCVVWELLPNLEGFSDHLFMWQLLSWFIFFSIMLNWILAARRCALQACTETVPQRNTLTAVMESLPVGWKNCPVCQVDVPPRTHHCKVCNVCILKRDHHCFFTGVCVGWANQRRFVVFILYTFLGSAYGLVLILAYLIDTKESWSYDWYKYLPAMSVFFCAFGDMPFWHLLLLFEVYASCIVMFVAGGFFLWEVCMVLRGQTTFEAAKGIHKYRKRPLAGFRSVFGDYGLIHFLVPLPIPQPGDGVNWTLYKDSKDN